MVRCAALDEGRNSAGNTAATLRRAVPRRTGLFARDDARRPSPSAPSPFFGADGSADRDDLRVGERAPASDVESAVGEDGLAKLLPVRILALPRDVIAPLGPSTSSYVLVWTSAPRYRPAINSRKEIQ